MSTLERAIAIAAEAHAGQVDKLGEPYIQHPLRMMLYVSPPDDKIVAVLHDVVEDCPAWPLSQIAAEGFAGEIITALDALTRRTGESYDDFVLRLKPIPLARRVKMADLRDNSNHGRLMLLPEKDRTRLWGKYARAIAELAF